MRNTYLWTIGAVLLAACYTSPAYREPAVSIAPSYGAATRSETRLAGQPVPQLSSAALPVARSAQPSVAIGVAPFWREIGDTTLAELVTEALRASPSAQSAEARVVGARASRRLAAFDLVPTVTASGSALRSQQSVDQVPGLANQLPRRDLYDVGF